MTVAGEFWIRLDVKPSSSVLQVSHGSDGLQLSSNPAVTVSWGSDNVGVGGAEWFHAYSLGAQTYPLMIKITLTPSTGTRQLTVKPW